MTTLTSSYHFPALPLELQIKTLLFACQATKDGSSSSLGVPKYATLLYLSILASVADTWQVEAYIQLCNMTTVNGEYTDAPAMRCKLSPFRPGPNPCVSNERG